MNKYQDSLNYLSDNCNIKERRCHETYCEEEYVHSGEEETKILQELIDKQNKYRWHDLRKDPNDLPEPMSTDIYVLADFNNYCNSSYGIVDFSLDGEWCIGDFLPKGINVIAWKYLEEFE